MAYYTEQEIYEHYHDDEHLTFHADVHRDEKTGEYLFIEIGGSIPSLENITKLREYLADNHITTNCKVDDYFYITFDHGSDSGPNGWEVSAIVSFPNEESVSAWDGWNDLVRIDVPLPPMDSPEYDEFTTEMLDDMRNDALLKACDIILNIYNWMME